MPLAWAPGGAARLAGLARACGAERWRRVLKTLVIGAKQVRDILQPAACIDVMHAAFLALARGEAVVPLRVAAWLPDGRGAIASMPAILEEPPLLGAKVITVFPGNRQHGLESHQGVVLLHDASDGRLVAVVDASTVTALRTAAVSALATRMLARPDAHVLTLLGSGRQAEEHLAALREVRQLKEVRVWSRSHANAQAFAQRHAHGDLRVLVFDRAAEALHGADIVCTVTAATEPILAGEWLGAGMHLNAVGASTPGFRELDAEAVARSRMFVDRRASAEAESSDYIVPMRAGAIPPDHIQGELADLVAGMVDGRRTEADITLFKSLGLAIEDLAAAHFVFREALARGIGTPVQIME